MNKLRKEMRLAYAADDDAALLALADSYTEEGNDAMAAEIARGFFWAGWDLRA